MNPNIPKSLKDKKNPVNTDINNPSVNISREVTDILDPTIIWKQRLSNFYQKYPRLQEWFKNLWIFLDVKAHGDSFYYEIITPIGTEVIMWNPAFISSESISEKWLWEKVENVASFDKVQSSLFLCTDGYWSELSDILRPLWVLPIWAHSSGKDVLFWNFKQDETFLSKLTHLLDLNIEGSSVMDWMNIKTIVDTNDIWELLWLQLTGFNSPENNIHTETLWKLGMFLGVTIDGIGAVTIIYWLERPYESSLYPYESARFLGGPYLGWFQVLARPTIG